MQCLWLVDTDVERTTHHTATEVANSELIASASGSEDMPNA